VSGRANDGGLRIGEMERDVVISHGATNFLKESMMDRGDKYHMAICNQTGMIAIYNPSKNLFMSPMADGPIQYTGSIDGKTMNIENITRFGRSFSVINIPYSLKLLIQELQTINLQMRIITEDNIAQIENMSYSKNIEKLMMKPGATMTDVINETKSKFYAQKTALGSPASVHEPDALDDAAKRQLAVLYGESLPYDSPDYDPNVSPPYVPNVSPPYATGSPAYDPNYDPSSPAYATGSPAYDPNYDPSSPAYATGSPTYHPNYGDNSPQYPDVSPAYSPEYNQNSPPYAPGSPPFAPTSTSASPPMARDFQVGDIVYLRGGKKSASPFNVIKKGDKFLTVESMDPTNQDDDSIQVVMPFELLKPEEIHEANMFERPMIRQGTGQGTGQGQGQNQSQIQGQGLEGQGIVFAPVIRIVNGNDNSTNDGSNDAVRDPTNNSMAQKDPFSVPVIKQTSDNGRVIKNVAEEPTAPVAAESQSGGGWLDFAKNLIIKKTG
jgi:hypothetical protein